jgi:hypothetical protein
VLTLAERGARGGATLSRTRRLSLPDDGSVSSEPSAAAWALRQVEAVRDDPAARLSRVLPDRYPLWDNVAAYVAAERNIGQVLDYGLIAPRLQQLYEWSAKELVEPRLLECIRDGSPTYAWPFADRDVWKLARPALPIRAIRRFLPW